MTSYRIYMLNQGGKIFHRGEDIQAADDAAAIAVGWTLLEAHNAAEPNTAHGIELWRGKLLIFSGLTG